LHLIEAGYWKLELGETPNQFVEHLWHCLIKWREMAGYTGTYEDLEDMILQNQYFLTLQCHDASASVGLLTPLAATVNTYCVSATISS